MNKQLKTALCLSGHMRSYKYTWENLYHNIIKPLNCDVYISTWETRDHTDYGYYGDRNDDNFIFLKNKKEIKRVEFEDQKEILEQKINPLIKKNNIPLESSGAKSLSMLNMWYKIKKSFEMLEGEYDLVIRSRPDLIYGFDDNFTLSSNITNLTFDVQKLNLPPLNGMAHNLKKYNPHKDTTIIGGYGGGSWGGGIPDIFAMSSYKNMKYYSYLYDYLIPYYKMGVKFHPETMLKYHLERKNIELNYLDYKFGILRELNED